MQARVLYAGTRPPHTPVRTLFIFAAIACTTTFGHATSSEPEGFAGVPWLSSPETAARLLKQELSDDCKGRSSLALAIQQALGCYGFKTTFAGGTVKVQLKFDDAHRLVGGRADFNGLREHVLHSCSEMLQVTRQQYGLPQKQLAGSGIGFEYANAGSNFTWSTAASHRMFQCTLDLRKDSGWWAFAHEYRGTARQTP